MGQASRSAGAAVPATRYAFPLADRDDEGEADGVVGDQLDLEIGAELVDVAAELVVGHEPDFSGTISALIGGGSVVMKKGGLARIDVVSRHPLRGSLVWLIAPKVYERLN